MSANTTSAASAVAAQPCVVMEGGLASDLERRGHTLASKVWSAELLHRNPPAIREVHRGFLEAGAQILKTASYQASRQGFEHEGIDGWVELMKLSVQLADEARAAYISQYDKQRPIAIAASLGPLGAAFGDGSEYTGWYGLSSEQLVVPLTSALTPGRQDVESIMGFHRERLAVLTATQADLIAFETIPCLLEVEEICRLLHEFPGKPAWISLQCRDETRLGSGELISDAVKVIVEHAPVGQVLAIGCNCVHPLHVSGIVRCMREAGWTEKIVAYANRGEAWDDKGKGWVAVLKQAASSSNGDRLYTPSDDEFVALVAQWKQQGVWAIGGCCRVPPDLIAKISESVCARGGAGS